MENINNQSINVELTDEELMAMTGGFLAPDGTAAASRIIPIICYGIIWTLF